MNKLRAIFCALFRHSNIVTNCMGYKYCGRCGCLIGDTLAGAWSNSKAVIVGHNCETCRENYERLTWRDKLLLPKKNRRPLI